MPSEYDQESDKEDLSVELEKNFGEGFTIKLLAGIFIGTSLAGIIAENTIQPYFAYLEKSGEISEVQSYLLHNFLNNIGDVTNGFMFASFAVAGDFMLSALQSESKSAFNETIRTLRKMLPFILCTLMWMLILDVETIQASKPIIGNIVGTADLKDIPAGLFGLLAGALNFEFYKKVTKSLEDED